MSPEQDQGRLQEGQGQSQDQEKDGQQDKRPEDRRQGDRRGPPVEIREILDRNYVFREREIGDLAFIVNSGTVEIVKDIDGKEVVLGTIGKGGMFGEMALIDDQPRMASARADGPVTVMVISSDMFARKLARIDPFARGLINILSDHVRRMSAGMGDKQDGPPQDDSP
ncbi:MAG: cyclic nucleotide-binding domain-containing protein [Rhodospirillales bacterium]